MPDNIRLITINWQTARLLNFFLLLLIASLQDIRTRTVSDKLCAVMALISLLPLEPVRMLGILAALPFLLAAVTLGGMGGGDIKTAGACGMVLGFFPALTGLMAGLILLLLFHRIRKAVRRLQKKEWHRQKEQAYPLVPFLMCGMFIATLLEGGFPL